METHSERERAGRAFARIEASLARLAGVARESHSLDVRLAENRERVESLQAELKQAGELVARLREEAAAQTRKAENHVAEVEKKLDEQHLAVVSLREVAENGANKIDGILRRLRGLPE